MMWNWRELVDIHHVGYDYVVVVTQFVILHRFCKDVGDCGDCRGVFYDEFCQFFSEKSAKIVSRKIARPMLSNNIRCAVRYFMPPGYDAESCQNVDVDDVWCRETL